MSKLPIENLPKDIPRGGDKATGTILGIAGIGVAGVLGYYLIKTGSSTLATYGNEGQQLFSQCSSTMTAQRADYIKYLNEYLNEGNGTLTTAQLQNLNTIQQLMSSTATNCTIQLKKFCAANPKLCPSSPIPTLANNLSTGTAIGAAIALAGVGAGLGAGIYKKMTKGFSKNPKASLTGSGNRGIMDNSVAQGKLSTESISPTEATNYENTFSNEQASIVSDISTETEAINAIAEETVISSAEESAITSAIDAEYQTTLDDFIALE